MQPGSSVSPSDRSILSRSISGDLPNPPTPSLLLNVLGPVIAIVTFVLPISLIYQDSKLSPTVPPQALQNSLPTASIPAARTTAQTSGVRTP